jgi:hypothetical protein
MRLNLKRLCLYGFLLITTFTINTTSAGADVRNINIGGSANDNGDVTLSGRKYAPGLVSDGAATESDTCIWVPGHSTGPHNETDRHPGLQKMENYISYTLWFHKCKDELGLYGKDSEEWFRDINITNMGVDLWQEANSKIPNPQLAFTPYSAKHDFVLEGRQTYFYAKKDTIAFNPLTLTIGGYIATLTATPTTITFNPNNNRSGPIQCPAAIDQETDACSYTWPDSTRNQEDERFHTTSQINWDITINGNTGETIQLPPITRTNGTNLRVATESTYMIPPTPNCTEWPKPCPNPNGN